MKCKSHLFLVILAVILTVPIFGINCGGGGGAAPSDITVTAKILLADGTEKDLSETPLPLLLKIQLTFSSAVDTTKAEALFSLTDENGSEVPRTITWNSDNTVMTVKPNNILDYQSTYTVAMTAGAVTDISTQSVSVKTDVAALSETFDTLVQSDVNGDGKADLYTSATTWQGGTPGEGGTGVGRLYLFYGNNIASGSATTAAAIIDGESNNDQFRAIWSNLLNFDVNDDGYVDIFPGSIFYNGGNLKGRSYIFYGGQGATPISGAINAANADLIMTGENDNDQFLVLYVDDVNGDGHSDLVGRAQGCTAGGNTGCVYAFFGPNFSSETASGADVTFTGESAGDQFGIRDRLGDVNGDGIADIISSAVYYNSGDVTGRVYVFYGGSSLTDKGAADADVIITGENTNNFFILQQLADFNGDGIPDILATANGYDLGRGRAYIFFGGNLTTENASGADVILTGEAGEVGFGDSAHYGDVTGDGIKDVIISSRSYQTNTGRIYGFAGGSGLSSKSATDADFILTGEDQNEYFSCALTGDVNGDGIEDIIAGAFGYPNGANQGRIYVFFGGSTIASEGAANADVIITGENIGDTLGPGRISDINGDGVMDLYLGAPNYPSGTGTGRGYIFYGGSGLSSKGAAQADAIITGENVLDRFGL